MVSMLSCKEKNEQISISKDNLNEQLSTLVKMNTKGIPINANLPLGYTRLSKLKCPVLWKADPENYGHLKSPGNKEFENLSAYYSILISSKTIGSPHVSTLSYLDINDHQRTDNYFDTVAAKQIDSCIYRLPNMKDFECYYFRNYSNKNSGGQYGNLLLLNNKTKAGKTITIYFEYGGEQNIAMRYFLIDKEKINIYEGSYYDDGCRLVATHKIEVDAAGELLVSKMKIKD